jgi:hypothetical protein
LALEAIRIDDDEFCFGVLQLIERSFGVTLPEDLRHIATAGDLFDEIIRLRPPTATGDKCDSAMVFYLLRRLFATVNPGKRITPSAQLKDISELSPKALRSFLAQQIGMAMPRVEPSALSVAIMLLTAPAALLMWWLVDALAFAATAVAGVLFSLADRGGFTGKWQSIRSLSHAIAQENIVLLAEMGARDRPEDWWRGFTRILADAAEPVDDEVRPLSSRRIGRDTRIELT